DGTLRERGAGTLAKLRVDRLLVGRQFFHSCSLVLQHTLLWAERRFEISYLPLILRIADVVDLGARAGAPRLRTQSDAVSVEVNSAQRLLLVIVLRPVFRPRIGRKAIEHEALFLAVGRGSALKLREGKAFRQQQHRSNERRIHG